MRPSRCSSISRSPRTVDRPDRLFEVLNMAQYGQEAKAAAWRTVEFPSRRRPSSPSCTRRRFCEN
jgi:hypothetical protein